MAHLVQGVDWVVEKRRVVWALSGVEKIRALLTLPPEKNASAPVSAVPAGLPVAVELLVYNPRLTNKRMILCYRPETDPAKPENIVRVRVRSSENFVRLVHGRPMVIKARHIQADLYELAGQCPRRKGWTAPE